MRQKVVKIAIITPAFLLLCWGALYRYQQLSALSHQRKQTQFSRLFLASVPSSFSQHASNSSMTSDKRELTTTSTASAKSRVTTTARLEELAENILKLFAKKKNSRDKPKVADINVVAQVCGKSGLRGPINLGKIKDPTATRTFSQIAKLNPALEMGGKFRPKQCMPVGDRVAIVIPYRDRDFHLRALIDHLHSFLQRQLLDYQIFVVEQAGKDYFNKALLMNVAFTESLQLAKKENSPPFNCYIFHDVDLLLEDDRGIYNCQDLPVHLSEYIDKFNYTSWGGTDVLFGGVVAIRKQVFQLVNGYSNIFFGWGAEDEEMRLRLKLHKVEIVKPQKDYYRYQMFSHEQDARNPWNKMGRELMGTTAERMSYDGLSSLRYQLVEREVFPTHTWFLVSFTQQDIYDAVFGTLKEKI